MKTKTPLKKTKKPTQYVGKRMTQKTEFFALRMKPETARKLRKIAIQTDVSMNTLINKALVFYFNIPTDVKFNHVDQWERAEYITNPKN